VHGGYLARPRVPYRLHWMVFPLWILVTILFDASLDLCLPQRCPSWCRPCQRPPSTIHLPHLLHHPLHHHPPPSFPLYGCAIFMQLCLDSRHCFRAEGGDVCVCVCVCVWCALLTPCTADGRIFSFSIEHYPHHRSSGL
jgi:hypothetical protein